MIKPHPEADGMATAEIRAAIKEADEPLRLAKEIPESKQPRHLARNCHPISRLFGIDEINGLTYALSSLQSTSGGIYFVRA
jgi:hypothetical protein